MTPGRGETIPKIAELLGRVLRLEKVSTKHSVI